ncbi:MAG: hypothetical protein Q9226_001709 [Calogaya cf. arnoldii]
MESQANVDIVVFPEKEISEAGDGDGAISAQSDRFLPFSIISTGMLDGLGATYTTCKQNTVKDSRNIQYSPVGKVTLRWHKNDQAKSYSELFYRPLPYWGSAANRRLTEDEKLAMAQKKLQADQRREQQKKEQAEKEAEVRRQATQKR